MQTLQERVGHLVNRLEAFSRDPDSLSLGHAESARKFYTYWLEINQTCIDAGYDYFDGSLSYVTRQLQILLANFQVNKTKRGIWEVFPPSIDNGFRFSCYIVDLMRIAGATETGPIKNVTKSTFQASAMVQWPYPPQNPENN